MATEKRFGRQTPTQSLILPYEETHGPEASEFYRESGREPQPWQDALIYDILSVNEEGLYTHTKFGYSVPRRNGKGEIITIRELYALMTGEKVLHTAHRTATSSSASLRLANLLKYAGYTEVIRMKKGETYENSYSYSKQFGLERITLIDTGGTVDFRTRTSKGGLGEGFDLLIVDEAQEYTDDQQSTLQYVVSDSANPQILLCGTPPTMVSSGTVFEKLRNECLQGKTEDTGWAEWSVDAQSDVNDVELWYETNPAMGFQLNERKIRSENKADDIDFNIQRLGLWIQYNQKSAITKQEWINVKVNEKPQFKGKIYAGVKYGHDGNNVSLGICVKTSDDKNFIEVIDCQPIRAGNDWLIEWILAMNPDKVVIDGSSGQNILADKLKEKKYRHYLLPKVAQVVSAHTTFEQCLENGLLCHNGQPSLEQSASNCEKRIISSGGWGYRSIKDGVDVSLLESVILANWACVEQKERKKQRIDY